MPEIRLDRARVVAVIGKLVAAGMAKHVSMCLDAQTSAMAARSIIGSKAALCYCECRFGRSRSSSCGYRLLQGIQIR